jgi:hypothetical protein
MPEIASPNSNTNRDSTALRSLFLSAAKGNPSAQKTMLNAVRAIEEADGDNNPARLVISWQETASTQATLANLLDQLDPSQLTDEQIDRLKELLKKTTPESE